MHYVHITSGIVPYPVHVVWTYILAVRVGGLTIFRLHIEDDELAGVIKEGGRGGSGVMVPILQFGSNIFFCEWWSAWCTRHMGALTKPQIVYIEIWLTLYIYIYTKQHIHIHTICIICCTYDGVKEGWWTRESIRRTYIHNMCQTAHTTTTRIVLGNAFSYNALRTLLDGCFAYLYV